MASLVEYNMVLTQEEKVHDCRTKGYSLGWNVDIFCLIDNVTLQTAATCTCIYFQPQETLQQMVLSIRQLQHFHSLISQIFLVGSLTGF